MYWGHMANTKPILQGIKKYGKGYKIYVSFSSNDKPMAVSAVEIINLLNSLKGTYSLSKDFISEYRKLRVSKRKDIAIQLNQDIDSGKCILGTGEVL